jgi:2-dehydro-3-deoxyphosphogluconate aldolase/(4S)-4-hydroxy-2-oxoglutarate aldolase
MRELLEQAAPVIPVITLQDRSQALPLADALMAGGIRTLEITLRTAAGVEAIELLRAERPELTIGAGTVTTEAELQQAADAGAQFAVSPGCREALIGATAAMDLPYLPGIATVTEAMIASDSGLRCLKFFPAGSSGGTAFLRSLADVLPDVAFCSTGGIDGANYREYLALPNVVCVGGSWITPPVAISSADWQKIRSNAVAVGNH